MLSLFSNALYHFIDTSADQRVAEWALMGGLGPLLGILSIYWLLVRIILPIMMQNRQPFELTAILVVYNTTQVIVCSWLVQQTVITLRRSNMSFLVCESTDYSDNPNAIRLAELCWWYLFIKLVDLVETVFFVLRKKENQVSSLHLYHHISTPIYSWAMVKFAAGGSPSLYMAINSAVHVVMYIYYLFTGIGMSKTLAPLKRYLTMLQMIQFGAVMLHASQVFFSECTIPKFLPAIFIPNVAFVYYLFSNFYSKAYKTQTDDSEQQKMKTT